MVGMQGSRRTKVKAALVAILAVIAGLAAVFWTSGGEESVMASEPAAADLGTIEMTVYKSPTCGCCSLWVDYVQEHDFDVEVVEDDAIDVTKSGLGIPRALWSCHTAVVGDYVIEGHIPADVIRRFVTEGSDMVGIAVPGMPVGSPGMEVGDRQESYDIIAFDREGNTRVYDSR